MCYYYQDAGVVCLTNGLHINPFWPPYGQWLTDACWVANLAAYLGWLSVRTGCGGVKQRLVLVLIRPKQWLTICSGSINQTTATCCENSPSVLEDLLQKKTIKKGPTCFSFIRTDWTSEQIVLEWEGFMSSWWVQMSSSDCKTLKRSI